MSESSPEIKKGSIIMSHFVHVSTTVSKLGPTIPTVNLPALVTCRPDAPCRTEGCYALQGNFRYPGVQKSMETSPGDLRNIFHEAKSGR